MPWDTEWIRTRRSIPRIAISNASPCRRSFLSRAGFPSARQRAKLAPGGVQPNLKPPTLISYSLRLEQQLTPNTSLTIGYVGSHGYHEILGVDANEPAPVICPASPCPATYPGALQRGWYIGDPSTGRLPCLRAPITCRPLAARQTQPATPACAGTWTWFSLGESSYNALQMDVNHRFSQGLSLRGVYTWSKALDDGDSLNCYDGE